MAVKSLYTLIGGNKTYNRLKTKEFAANVYASEGLGILAEVRMFQRRHTSLSPLQVLRKKCSTFSASGGEGDIL